MIHQIDFTPTPNGDWSLAYFKDKDGNPVDKSKAASIEVIEFDTKGSEVFRTYADFGPR
jgi:hypothetical protein